MLTIHFSGEDSAA